MGQSSYLTGGNNLVQGANDIKVSMPTDRFLTILYIIYLCHQLSPHPNPNYKNILNPKAMMRLTAALDKDPFIIDFGRFYQLSIRISQVVYKSLYHNDPTAALNKLMHEGTCCVCAGCWVLCAV